jgi:hypothetical protein
MAVLFVADELLQMARKACERSRTYPPEAIAAIVLSVIGFEAFLNEMVELSSGPPHPSDEPEEVKAFGAILEDLEQQKAPIDVKVQVAYYIFKRQRLDKGELPYQDFDLLIRIRNALVHKKPEKWSMIAEGEAFEPHKLVKRLADRKVIPPPTPEAPPELFIPICRQEVAKWAYNVVVEMISFLTEVIPPSKLKEFLSLFRSLRPI